MVAVHVMVASDYKGNVVAMQGMPTIYFNMDVTLDMHVSSCNRPLVHNIHVSRFNRPVVHDTVSSNFYLVRTKLNLLSMLSLVTVSSIG